MPEQRPTHGFTPSGRAVHANTMDHLPNRTRYQQFNKDFAVKVTNTVGSMTCAYVFGCIALVSLPAVINETGWLPKGTIPSWLVSVGLIALITWIAQTFLQLVLLSVIIVGQNVQQEAADVRASKTFGDTEVIVDRLDVHTDGGITDILQAIRALEGKVDALTAAGHRADPD